MEQRAKTNAKGSSDTTSQQADELWKDEPGCTPRHRKQGGARNSTQLSLFPENPPTATAPVVGTGPTVPMVLGKATPLRGKGSALERGRVAYPAPQGDQQI